MDVFKAIINLFPQTRDFFATLLLGRLLGDIYREKLVILLIHPALPRIIGGLGVGRYSTRE